MRAKHTLEECSKRVKVLSKLARFFTGTSELRVGVKAWGSRRDLPKTNKPNSKEEYYLFYLR
jgi:hypothetical protein